MVLVAASSSAASAASGMLEKSLILEWALEKLCTAAAALAHTIRHLGRRRTRLFIVSLVITSGSSTPTPSAL